MQHHCLFSDSKQDLRFLGGRRQLEKKLACEQYIAQTLNDQDKCIEVGELIANDRRCDLDSGRVPVTLESWLKDRSVQNREIYVNSLAAKHAAQTESVVSLCCSDSSEW